MSLWSPVDLVNGSGSRNVKNSNNSLTNGNTSRNYEQILEQLNAKLFPNQQLTSDGKCVLEL